jgi:hypothetical protein
MPPTTTSAIVVATVAVESLRRRAMDRDDDIRDGRTERLAL